MTRPATEPIEVSSMTPPLLRWGLGMFGAAMAALAIHELWRGVWPLSILTPFFGLMLVAVLSGTGGLVIGAIVGPDEVWRIEQGRLTIRKSLRGVRSIEQYSSANIGGIRLETSEWDSRPASYYLVVNLVTGKKLRSPEFGTEAKARAVMAMLAVYD